MFHNGAGSYDARRAEDQGAAREAPVAADRRARDADARHARGPPDLRPPDAARSASGRSASRRSPRRPAARMRLAKTGSRTSSRSFAIWRGTIAMPRSPTVITGSATSARRSERFTRARARRGRAARASGCSACRPPGDVDLCHRFAGSDDHKLGTVRDGIDRDAQRAFLESHHVANKTDCQTCWARPLCAGGCYHEAHTRHGSTRAAEPALLRVDSRLDRHLPADLRRDRAGESRRSCSSSRSHR